MTRLVTATLFLFSFILACGGDNEPISAEKDFRHNVKTPEGVLLVEEKMQPRAMASAFLINREKAIFLTADHFTVLPRAMGIDDFQLAFSGRVHNVTTLKVFRLYDVAVLRITDNVDAQNFPKEYKISDDGVEIGDTVFVRGIHVHPPKLQQLNRERGHPDNPVRLREDYYNLKPAKAETSKEYVHDNLMAVVDSVGVELDEIGGSGSKTPRRIRLLRGKANNYFTVKTELDHKISFGGLSGGAVVNSRGEVVGVVTAEPPIGCDLNRACDGEVRTVIVTPISSIRDQINEFLP